MKRWLAIIGVGGILSGCSGMPQVNSEPKFKTQYNASETTFQGVPTSKYSNAEMRNLFIYHIEAPQDVIFDETVRLKGMEGVRWDDNGTGIEGPGKGTIRWVSSPGGEIREEIMEYDPPHMHFYQIDPEKSTFKLKLKHHIAAVTVESDGATGSLVTWRIYYDYTMNPLTLLKKPIFNTAIPQVLDGLVKTHGGTRLQPE
jgi:hypothetical protein